MFNRNKPRTEGDYRKGGLVRSGVRALSGGIGLVSESFKASGRNKSGSASGIEPAAVSEAEPADPAVLGLNQAPQGGPQTQGGRDPDLSSEQEVGLEESLEGAWALDDAQATLDGDEPENVSSEEGVADAFIRAHQIPDHLRDRLGKLPLPVVLPQRRPKTRSRGFIRAYAPVLENAGIDQATWISFLDLFQASSAANPWLNAINLASFAGFAVPHFGGAAIGLVVGEIVKLSMEFDSRGKTNDFLHNMNTEFFQPRGLYCLVMTYDPSSTSQIEQVNLAETITSRISNAGDVAEKYRRADGTTSGAMNFPETAPLVFPSLDQLAAETGEEGEKKQNAIVKKIAFVNNYWDKRATAEYAIGNSDTPLAQVPLPEFQSRYADPKSHAASGSLIAFVSGGKLVPNPESRGLIGGLINVTGQAIRGEKQGSGWEAHEQAHRQQNEISNRGLVGRYSRNYGGRKLISGLMDAGKGGYSKLMGKNVLYLMVVNMPTRAEMEAVTRQ